MKNLRLKCFFEGAGGRNHTVKYIFCRIIGVLFFLFISVLLPLLAIEVILRCAFELKEPLDLGDLKSQTYTVFDSPGFDRYGFREEEVQEGVFNEEFTRILFLGDSFTFGQGVRKGADRFSDLIEKYLNDENVLNKKYHVYNAGACGTEADEWYQYLKSLSYRYKPHYVFVIFFKRDGTSFPSSLRAYETIIGNIKKPYIDSFIYRHSYIGKHICHYLIVKEFNDFYTNGMLKSYIGSDKDKTEWVKQQRFLKRIARLCEKNKMECHLVIFPYLFSLESGYQFYAIEEEIIRFAQESDIAVFSLTQGFIGVQSSTLWVSASDQHPNEKAHKIAADTLYPYLKKVIENH